MDCSPAWSPDGGRIVFDSNREGQFELYAIDEEGGKPQRLTDDPGDDAVASWSRDGNWIYFMSNRTGARQVWKLPAGGGDPVQVTRHGGYVAVESRDGRTVYYSKDSQGLWRVPAEGGEETQVVPEGDIGVNFQVGSNGIYFFTPAGSSVIQFLRFATGKIETVAKTDNPAGIGLSVSPDGRYILYSQVDDRGSDLMLMENFR